ncbi:rab11 family-interacting protein 3-like [Ctenocephalides felis]|uniref:rab11 family-interacting protein 3-like n=1 Tax=Ctenocephalides felis TaxID=7515 RepID=UPI000E6E25F5|nr:rab11 family-interacting protein 3-like [Ctenocephalides felis]
MSSQINGIQASDRSRSCVGLTTPLSSRPYGAKLFRSLSFNSSGGSSTGNRTMDLSFDDNLHELTYQVNALEEKITHMDIDQRRHQSKTEKAVLHSHVLNLEDKLIENEERFKERFAEEQRKYRDLQNRMQREIQLLTENKAISLQSLEKENERLKEDNRNLRLALERKDQDQKVLEDKIREMRVELTTQMQSANKKIFEANEELRKYKSDCEYEKSVLKAEITDLKETIGQMRTRRDSEECLEYLQSEITDLRQQNRALKETNEELQLCYQHEETRECCSCQNSDTDSCNLAAELEAFVSEQADLTMTDIQEENVQLKNYLECLLVKILKHYPQILEIKK